MVTQGARSSRVMDVPGQLRSCARKGVVRGDGEPRGHPRQTDFKPNCRETADSARYYREFVPQSDTGRLAKYAKARERTLAKELGKMAP